MVHIAELIKSRRLVCVRCAAFTGETNVYKILVRKPEGTRPLRRNRHRWEGNGRKVWTGTSDSIKGKI
jgi:hypothetical protein